MTLKDSSNNILANKNVKIYINNKIFTLTTDSKGQAKVKLLMTTPKKYKVVTKFLGTSQYLAKSQVSYVTVKKVVTNISASNMYCDVNKGKAFTITLKNKNNKVLVNKKVKFKLNGKIYSRTTNSKGQASITVKLPSVKTYKILSYYGGSYYYEKVSKTNKLYVLNNRTPVVISVPIIKTGLDKSTKINITLKDKNNKILSNRNLVVSLNSKVYNLKTNSSGVASFNFKSSSLKKYTFNVNFEGNKIYQDASVKSTIKVIQTTLTIQNNKIVKGGYLRVLLNNNYNEDLPNEKVIISINGKNYAKNTNTEGIVSLKCDLTVGDYLVSATYNDIYCGLISQTKKFSCIKGTIVNPLSGAVPLVKGVPDVDYMPSNYVWAVDNKAYTLSSAVREELEKEILVS